jgi:hypothetical protein
MKAFPIMTTTLTSLPEDEAKEQTLCTPFSLTLILFPLFLYFSPHSMSLCVCVCVCMCLWHFLGDIYIFEEIYLLASVLVLLSGVRNPVHTHDVGPLVGDTNRRKERQKAECL